MGKVVIRRVDFNYLYQDGIDAYQKAGLFATQNIGLKGVGTILEQIESDHREYNAQREALRNEETENENKKYMSWKSIHKYKEIAIIAAVVCFILNIFVPGGYGIVWMLKGLFSMVVFVLVVAAVALVFVEKAEIKQYQHYVENVEQRIRNMNAGYLQKIDAHQSKIDGLYLASLDPTQREMVLMRRDQERQHQEMMRMQRAYQLEQQRLREEQAETRRIQEKLLAIEREREERYKRW